MYKYLNVQILKCTNAYVYKHFQVQILKSTKHLTVQQLIGTNT